MKTPKENCNAIADEFIAKLKEEINKKEANKKEKKPWVELL